MIFSSVFFLLVIVVMAGFIRTANAERDMDVPPSSVAEFVMQRLEYFVLYPLQISLYFLCYGVSRMICQRWMWELHFQMVCIYTIVALVSGLLFILLVAPAVPAFCIAMGLPPYWSNNWRHMKLVLVETSTPRASKLP